MKTNWSAATTGDVPYGVWTVTSTVPAAWTGALAVICVSDTTVTLVAATVPKKTFCKPALPEKPPLVVQLASVRLVIV